MSIQFHAMTNAELSARGTYADDAVRIALIGTADTSEAKGDLEALLTSMHEQVVLVGAPKVVLDLRELGFVNSSSFKVFVTWLSQVRALEPTKQYKIHLVSSPAQSWQKRSLRALSCFAADLIVIET